MNCNVLHPTQPFHHLTNFLDIRNRVFFAQNEPKMAILGRFSKFSHSNKYLSSDMAMIHVWVTENHGQYP